MLQRELPWRVDHRAAYSLEVGERRSMVSDTALPFPCRRSGHCTCWLCCSKTYHKHSFPRFQYKWSGDPNGRACPDCPDSFGHCTLRVFEGKKCTGRVMVEIPNVGTRSHFRCKVIADVCLLCRAILSTRTSSAEVILSAEGRIASGWIAQAIGSRRVTWSLQHGEVQVA